MALTFTNVEIPRPPARTRRSPAKAVIVKPKMEHLCPNCDVYFPAARVSALYCSLRCTAESGFVRYTRRKLAMYPHGLPKDIAEAVLMQRAHALAGGYDKRARRLPPETRALVIDRDKGKCILCGDAGTEIDHIDGASGDPANLRLLCHDCHMEITRARFVPITDAETKGRAEMLDIRVGAPEPLRECDADGWPGRWRSFIREHARSVEDTGA